MQPVNKNHNGYLITTDKNLVQPEAVHKWLSEESYWTPGIAFEKVKGAIDNSFCISVLQDGRQVGFARLITDYTSFGYLADVYIHQEHQGKGLGKMMMKTLFEQDWIKGLRRVLLATKDAHGLYKQFGFTALTTPERLMEQHPDKF